MGMKPTDWHSLTFFKADEFSKPEEMDYGLLLRLNNARKIARTPFEITSSYRTDDLESSHAYGLAVDIACTDSSKRWRIVEACITAGFNRIGIYDKHIHVDVDPAKAQDVMWWGVSK